jgi:hypothetical protein
MALQARGTAPFNWPVADVAVGRTKAPLSRRNVVIERTPANSRRTESSRNNK